MSNEYVRLTTAEVNYTKKHLLNIELESLTSLKKLKEYKDLRSKELNMKISLKTALDSLSQELIIMDKLLPHTSWDKKDNDEMIPSIHTMEIPQLKAQENNELENQLDEIRKKLARLQ